MFLNDHVENMTVLIFSIDYDMKLSYDVWNQRCFYDTAIMKHVCFSDSDLKLECLQDGDIHVSQMSTVMDH